MESPQHEVKMSGYLYKKSKVGFWQKRFFETSGNRLVYYKTKKRGKALAALNLLQTGEIKKYEADVSMTNKSSSKAKDTGLFTIELDSRTYSLQAKHNVEANKWITKLNQIKTDYKSQLGTDNNAQSNSDSLNKKDKATLKSFDTTLDDHGDINHDDAVIHQISPSDEENMNNNYMVIDDDATSDWYKPIQTLFEYFSCTSSTNNTINSNSSSRKISSVVPTITATNNTTATTTLPSTSQSP